MDGSYREDDSRRRTEFTYTPLKQPKKPATTAKSMTCAFQYFSITIFAIPKGESTSDLSLLASAVVELQKQ